MRRVWLSIRASVVRLWPNRAANSAGFSAVEILLAASVFGFLVTALSGAIIYGRAGTAASGDRVQAVALAEEGCEAVRNIRDAAWANIPGSGVRYLAQSGGVWTLTATAEPAIGIYTRQINFGTPSSNRIQAQCQVSWTTAGVNRSVTVTTYVTNWAATITPPITPGPIMMVYSRTTTTPYYRIWSGLNWSGEATATATGISGNINYMVVKSSRTRDEAILGVQTTTGGIYVQVWNGTTQTWGTVTQVGTGPTTTRSFDISYEKNGDRAVIAFTPTGTPADFAVRTWDGSNLSGATTITTSPTTGAINWIEMKQNPLASSNEIALILSDANADVFGMRWNSATNTFVQMETVVTWDTTASNAARKGIDVEYEQTSGQALFLWGDSLTDVNNYRTWNGTTLTNLQTVTIAGQGGVTDWVQLAARPSSDEIMLGVQDAAADLNTVLWSGSGWGTPHTTHATTTENINSRNFDILWETHASNPGEAWLMWGDSAAGATAGTVRYKAWTGSWPGTNTTLTSSDDTAFIRMRADPVSGAIFAVLYEDTGSATDDIWETHLTGGGSTWTAKSIMWGGPTTATPAHFKVDISTP